MKRWKRSIVSLLGILILPAFGDIIHLRDGTMVTGKIVKADSANVSIRDERGIQLTIPRERILTINYESSVQSSTTSAIDHLKIKSAGQSLRRFRNLYFGGMAGTLLGSMLTTLSDDPGVVALGGLITVTSFIVQIIAVNSVGTAGDHLANAAK